MLGVVPFGIRLVVRDETRWDHSIGLRALSHIDRHEGREILFGLCWTTQGEGSGWTVLACAERHPPKSIELTDSSPLLQHPSGSTCLLRLRIGEGGAPDSNDCQQAGQARWWLVVINGSRDNDEH